MLQKKFSNQNTQKKMSNDFSCYQKRHMDLALLQKQIWGQNIKSSKITFKIRDKIIFKWHVLHLFAPRMLRNHFWIDNLVTAACAHFIHFFVFVFGKIKEKQKNYTDLPSGKTNKRTAVKLCVKFQLIRRKKKKQLRRMNRRKYHKHTVAIISINIITIVISSKMVWFFVLPSLFLFCVIKKATRKTKMWWKNITRN